MKRDTMLISAVILLIIMNLGLMAFLLFSKPEPQDFPQRWGNKPPLDEKFGFQEAQREVHQRLKDTLFNEVKFFDKKLDSVVQVYFSLLRSEHIAALTVREIAVKDSLEQVIADLHRKKAALFFEHFRQVKLLYPKEKWEQFDSLVPELSNTIRSRPPKGPRPDGGHPKP